MESTATSDKSMGLSVAFGAAGIAAAVAMFLAALGHDQLGSGLAFAVAMLAGGLAITAVHVYD